MNTLWKQFVAWVKSKNITAHVVFVAAVSAAGIITADQQVQDFIVELFKAHPALGSEIIALAVIISKYSHSSSPAGIVAGARDVNDGPNATTVTQVNAADPKIQ